MDKKTFIAVGEAAYGDTWQSQIAKDLGVADRTVRRWVSGESALPTLLSADIVRVLNARKLAIEGALKMSEEVFLMNPLTGSVDDRENWLAEMPTWTDDPAENQRQFNLLIEVVKDVDGDWVEKE